MDKYNVKTNLYQQNLLELNLNTSYEKIIMPTGSFCLLPKDQIEIFLNNILNHLNSNGKFIFDLIFPINYKEKYFEQYSFEISNNYGVIYTTFNENIDWINQKTTTISKYELVENGVVKETEYSNFICYWYGLNEIKLLLKSNGFKNIEIIKDYNSNINSNIYTVIASK